MLGNFMYSNPTRLYFGEGSLKKLGKELKSFGRNVMLVYGCGSVKRNGIYDKVTDILLENGCRITEDPGVMPNPTVQKLYEGCRIARENDIDLILAVGGGSVCDYAKAVSVSACCREDPWERFYLSMKQVENRIIPVGCIPTTAGTGSEMNGCAVITDPGEKLKIGHVFGENVYPRFAVLDPCFTYTMPRCQMACGIFDIMSHLTEQYFSGTDDSTSDYIMEGFMRSLIHSSRAAMADPRSYEARSNIMWISTWALNTFLSRGKKTDWMVHMIAQSVGAYTNAPHGLTLSAIAPAYYRFIYPYGLPKFARFAKNVWDVGNGRDGGSFAPDDTESIAVEGLKRMEAWMRELGLSMNIRDLGVTEDMYDGIIKGIKILRGGYKRLTRPEIISILKKSAGEDGVPPLG